MSALPPWSVREADAVPRPSSVSGAFGYGDAAIEAAELLVDNTTGLRRPHRDWVAADPSTLPSYQRPFQAANRLWCRNMARTNFAAGPIVGGVSRDVCEPYLTGEGISLPEFNGPDFTGGQCDVDYRVRYNIGNINNAVTSSILGPITDISQTTEPVPNSSNFVSRLFVTGANGTNQEASFLFNSEQSYTIVGVERVDGQPDDCGNPDGGQWEPTDPGLPEPPTVQYCDPDEGWCVDISIEGPTIDADGNLDFTLCAEGICINLGALYPGNNAAGSGRIPTDYENPVTGPVTDGGQPGGQNPGGLDEDVECLSCVGVSLVNFPPNLGREVGGPEDRPLDCGWFRWKTAGSPFVTKSQRITEGNVLFCCPEEHECTGYQVKANFGYSLGATVYLQEKSQE